MHGGVLRTVPRALLRAGNCTCDPCRSFPDGAAASEPPEDRSSYHPPYRHGERHHLTRSARFTSAGFESRREGWPDYEVRRNKFARFSPLYRGGRVAGRPCPHYARSRACGRSTSLPDVDRNDIELRDLVRSHSKRSKGYGPQSRGARHFEPRHWRRSPSRSTPHR